MSYPKIYRNLPQKGEYVSIIITDNREEGALPVELPDYGCTGLIPITSLTKKKKIRSIKKIAPVDKILPAIVESTDREIIMVSRLNLNKSSPEYQEWEDQKNSSRVINSLVKYFIKKGVTEEHVLSTIVYPLVEANDTELNNFDYIKNNYESLELSEELSDLLDNYMKATKFVKKIDYTTHFGMAATESVSEMVEVIKPVVNKYNNLKIVIEDFPIFVIKSDSNNSKQSDHLDFLEELDTIENKNFQLKKNINS